MHINSFFKFRVWVSEMAQWMAVLTAESDSQSLISGIHLVKGESNSYRLCSDLHVHICSMCMLVHIYANAHKKIIFTMFNVGASEVI